MCCFGLACNTYKDKQRAEPMMSYPIPTRPWVIISQDLFSYKGEEYMITVDHYSDFWELDCITGDTRAEVVVDNTKRHFARHGVPDTVITDNGPQFVAHDYATFAREWEFHHVTSSPYHSQANGKAEATVKIAKRLIKKTKANNQDLYLAILEWRNTPSDSGTRSSPVQKLMSRRTNTLLPTPEGLLQPSTVHGVPEEIKIRKQKAKLQYDKGTKPLPELEIGQPVRIQPNKYNSQWTLGQCIDKVGPRSYLVQNEDGQMFRRNRKFLRTTQEQDQSLKQQTFSQPVTEENSKNNTTKTTAAEKCITTTSESSPAHRQAAQVPEKTSRPAATKTPVKSSRSTTASMKVPVDSTPPTKSTRTRASIKPPARYKDYVK